MDKARGERARPGEKDGTASLTLEMSVCMSLREPLDSDSETGRLISCVIAKISGSWPQSRIHRRLWRISCPRCFESENMYVEEWHDLGPLCNQWSPLREISTRFAK